MFVDRLSPRFALAPLVLAAALLLGGCAGAEPLRQSPRTPAATGSPAATDDADIQPVIPIETSPSAPSTAPAAKVMLGIDVLEQQDFAILKGKRIGLLTHPAGVNRFGLSTIDVIRRDKRLRLTALYGPEHGIYGDEVANAYVPDRVDAKTGLHIFSLYAATRKPTPEMLRGIDVMVIDLQDIGVRSYTYVSCMRYTIEACFENGVEVVILDRPNPLGGLKVGGPILEKQWLSYVGAFRVPYVHGLTIGELARIAASEPGVLQIDENVRKQGRLTVVPMHGWTRSMRWPETGLTWIPTSPNIPSFEAVVGYAMAGLGAQLGGFRHGIGTPHPFRLLTHPAITPAEIAAGLSRRHIPGLRYVPMTVSDAKGRSVSGIFVDVADWDAWRPTDLSFHMMQMACAANPTNPFKAASGSQADLFNKHVGSTPWWTAITRDGARVNVTKFLAQWDRDAKAFQMESRHYWLYSP